MNWFAFLMTEGSMSRSLTRMGNKMIWLSWDRILHCWNQTQVKHCNNVPEIFEDQLIDFCVCKKWVEAQISLSQSFRSACSRRLWRWVSFSMMLPSLIFIVVSTSGNKFFIFALLWEAKFSTAPIRVATRWWGSELQRKNGLKKLIQISGHVCLSKLLYLCLWRLPPGHKLIESRFLLKVWRVFVYLCTWYWKSPACQRDFLGIDICSSDRHFSLVYCM